MTSQVLAYFGGGLLLGLLFAWDRKWSRVRRRLWYVLLPTGCALLVLNGAILALSVLATAVDGSPEENAHVRLVSGLNVLGAAALLVGGDARRLAVCWASTAVGVAAFVLSLALWDSRYKGIVSSWIAEPSIDSFVIVGLPLGLAGLALVQAFAVLKSEPPSQSVNG